MRVRRLIGLATTGVALLVPVTPAHAAPTAPLGQKGRWITDAAGRTVILHGVNMVNKVQGQGYRPSATGFGADDARFLHDNGFNTVRLGVIYAGVEPSPGKYSDGYLANIAGTASQLARENVFPLLDFHQDLYNEKFQGEGWPCWGIRDDGLPPQPQTGFPGNYVAMPALNRAFDHFWANDPPLNPPCSLGGAPLQDSYAAAWRHVASRFQGDAHVLGYDLLNEPWPGSQWPSCANTEGCPAFDQTLTAFSRRATNRIRQVDSRHIVWYEPNVIFNDGAKTSHGDTGPNAGMSFHIYCLAEGNTADPSPVDPVQSQGCGPFEDLPYQNAEDQSRRTGDALLLTEFGATNDLENIRRVVEGAEHHMVGWQYWHYCQCGDPTTSGAGASSPQALVLDPHKPPSGANVKSAKLGVLSRAYPQAVQGTPTGYDFNPDRKTFELRYSTARLGGGSFRFNADTQIFVPPRHFPRGYDVVTEGGQASSGPNARELRVRNCTGRRRVRVRLAPGRGRMFADCHAPGVRQRGKRFRIRLKVRPRRTRAGRRRRYHFRATIRLGRRRIPVRRARIRFARRVKRTGRRGRARIRVRLRRPGRHRAKATKRGLKPGRATVRVRRRHHAHRRH